LKDAVHVITTLNQSNEWESSYIRILRREVYEYTKNETEGTINTYGGCKFGIGYRCLSSWHINRSNQRIGLECSHLVLIVAVRVRADKPNDLVVTRPAKLENTTVGSEARLVIDQDTVSSSAESDPDE
jgi:hypothetical protein